jgi:hypothetical protein
MTLQIESPVPRCGAETGLEETSCLSADYPKIAPNRPRTQAIIAAIEEPDRARARLKYLARLRLVVPPASPPRRRLAARISVLDGRVAFGRSRAFRLAESDIDELIAIAQRMERWP